MAGILENTRKPKNNLGGRLMLWGMNIGHSPNAKWSLKLVDLSENKKILDIGCGGGKNIKNMLRMAPEAMVCAMDYSPASVAKSRSLNRESVDSGRVEVKEASVEQIPYSDGEFDSVTAFETIYFWPDISANFTEVARVLKKEGLFMICNEAQRPETVEMWINKLNMIVYTGEEIENLMQISGFSDIQIHKHKNGSWLCVTGRKK